jgi:micrococcal nuclease
LLGWGVVVLAALVAIGSFGKPDVGLPTTALGAAASAQSAVPAPTPTDEPSTTASPTFGPTAETTKANVVRVVDGDTIVVSFGGKDYKVRYIGMDAPETSAPNTAVQWMGPQATAANAALVAGKTVYLEKDVSEVDRYGRLLRYVWTTDGAAWTLVNLELVRQGVAFAKSYPPDIRYDVVYEAAQGDAMGSALGLWGTPPAEATAAPTPKATPKPTPRPTPKPTPRPTPRPTPKPASKCHPSYDPCLPIVADLDCPDIRAMGLDPVTVIGPDSYRLDGDHDGLGCE